MKKEKKKDIGLVETSSETRKRNAKRIPVGVTKSEILLFIADKDSVDSVDLKWHLKEVLGIKNKKSLKIHILELTERKLLNKESIGKGLPDTYYLTKNFSTLQGIFNFLKENKKEKELLRTKYFREYVTSEDFISKFPVSFLKEILLSMFEYVSSEEGSKELLEEYDKKSEEYAKAIGDIKMAKTVTPKYTQLKDIEKALDLYKSETKNGLSVMVSSLVAILDNAKVDELYDIINSIDIVSGFIHKLPEIIMPKRELPLILAMIKASPSVADFMLNLKKFNPVGIMGIVMRYSIWGIRDDPKKLSAYNKLVKEKHITDKFSPFYELLVDLSRVESKSPLYTVASSLFLFDYINRNILLGTDENELLEAVLIDMIAPKIKKGIL